MVSSTMEEEEESVRPQVFEASSQYRHWRFSIEELFKLREKVNSEGRVRVEAAIAEERALENGDDKEAAKIDCLTAEEQLLYCRFYEGKLIDYCRYFKFDRMVQATAMAFFKRFYLLNTVMDYDPKLYLMTCLFLATKVEHSHISLENFLAKIPKSPSSDKMVELEFTLSRGIRFEYMVHHPFWPLHGQFLDIQSYISSTQPLPAHEHLMTRLRKSYDRAQHFAQIATLTDLQFTHMPSQIALGCLLAASQETGFTDTLKDYLSTRLNETPEKMVALYLLLEEVMSEVRDQPQRVVDKAQAQDIASKLRGCQNPEYIPESALYKYREEQEAKEREERHSQKARSERQRKDNDMNVFGEGQ
ncbi:cyclin-like protein [Phlyctochytrium arcticum]|nr:cyclin-like protein [Phlyctochytrium arcticum]